MAQQAEVFELAYEAISAPPVAVVLQRKDPPVAIGIWRRQGTRHMGRIVLDRRHEDGGHICAEILGLHRLRAEHGACHQE
jgi:hypothetical protein